MLIGEILTQEIDSGSGQHEEYPCFQGVSPWSDRTGRPGQAPRLAASVGTFSLWPAAGFTGDLGRVATGVTPGRNERRTKILTGRRPRGNQPRRQATGRRRHRPE
jgi:hypothetical protein